ncbi:SpoIIIAH-like family protein [Thermodesulfitimonas autotrophica]|uniref:SpoIIIAH-like family protein n=1 Tax=Thermodesulfitimonas autotrophica TaxID=1894989 RepID=UPI002FE0B690
MARFVLLPKRVVVGFVVLLLAGGVALTACGGWTATKDSARQAAGKVTVVSAPYQQEVKAPRDSFFVDYSLEREINRSRQLELLREIASGTATDEATRKQAQERLMVLSERAEKEARLEGILRAKGFEDAAVAIGEQSVTVIVPGRVPPEETTTIAALVYHTVGVPQEQVVILGHE